MVRDGVVSDFHASIKMVIDEIRADLTSIGIYDYTNESVMKQDLSGTMEEIDSKYEEMLLHVKDEILKCKTQIKNSYLSQISSKLEEYDEFYRTEAYFGERTIFSTREEADKAREEIKYIENVLKDVSAPARDSFLDYKDDIEKKIKDISDNTTTIVKEPCLKLLNSYLDEFDRLYLDTGVLFKSKTIEEASRKRFTNAFKFNSMDLSSYEKIDYAWKQIDEYIVRLKMTREQLNAELAPMYLAENALNSVDGCCFDTREDAENARMELAGINKILADVTLSDSVDIRYEEKINEALNNIRNFKTNIKDKYIAILSEELDKFDLRYKTVDGIVFNTREEAEEARRELTAIFQLLDGVRPPDKNSMLDYETNVKEKLNIIQSDYHTVIAEKYAEVLKKYLLDFDVTFRNVSLFGDKSREDAAQKRLMNEISRLKFTCWEDVDNAKIFLDDITHKLGIDRNLVPEYDKMIENKENILKTIDGIHFDTREDADMARKEYESIKNLLSDVRPPKKTDYLDYEWKIREKLDKLNVNYTTVIKNKYIELMNKYLDDFDDVFCRISMFKRGTREEAARTKALKFVKEAKLTSTMDVETTRKKLMELLPFLGLQQEDVVEAEQYLDQRKDEIVNGAPANSGNGKFGKFFKT